ncbi:kallikrein-11 [Copidosoma floridanum]|uniref:kallikrein-11 n=1 Tax=Copidosoma floridanum TaxID=29053 RepID=UPI0006C9D283|nr:kallikrein-11 [Copidosoma floridanum]
MISGHGAVGIGFYYSRDGIWLNPQKTHKLNYANVTVFERHKCTTNHQLFVEATDQMICGQVSKPNPKSTTNVGTCKGDEGSSLVVNDTIIGVLSVHARGCNETGSHSIYTRVSHYLGFIDYAKKDIVTDAMHVYHLSRSVRLAYSDITRFQLLPM